MTHHEQTGYNGDTILKRITSVAGMIISLSAVISLVVYLYGAQVFATKADMNCVVKDVKDNYLTKELFNSKMETVNVKMDAIAHAVGARYPRP